nr:TonB-dependent receptor [Saprospiraceae bacterium]
MKISQKVFIGVFILLFLLVGIVHGQNGIIRGHVIDGKTGEDLIAATVFIPSIGTGTSTDLDGKFSIHVPEGSYVIKISYLSYQTITVTEIVVEADEVTLVPNISLEESGVNLGEATVTATAVRSSEAAVMLLKKNSTTVLDGISSSNIKLVGDATAIEAAKRVTGVSIEEGKYIYVRGLGDRYTKVMLNKTDIPGLDPDKNSLQMDIFPTSLIDNITVNKTFGADMPADFTGGIVNLETKDFPEEKIFEVSAGFSYNSDMHFKSDFLTYDGGSTDFLGFDDGRRDLPGLARSSSIPTPVSGASTDQVTRFVNSFDPQLGAKTTKSFMDYDASITLGNQFQIGRGTAQENKLGYIFSASYRSDYRLYNEVFYGEYQKFIDPEKLELRYATTQEGRLGEHSVLIGILGGLAYQSGNSKYRLTAMHLQNGESRAGQFDLDNDGAAVGQSGYIAYSDNLEYNQRSMTNVLLNGTHKFQENNWEMDWRLATTLSDSYDPDIRRTAFTVLPNRTIFAAGAGGNPSRIWRNLDEINTTSRIDLSKKFNLFSSPSKFKFGGMHTYKDRDYEILFYDIQFFGEQSWGENPTASQVLEPENLYPAEVNNVYYQSGNANPNPNEYQSNVNNFAGYTSLEFNPVPKLKAVLGIRGEYYVQRHTGRDQAYAGGNTAKGNNLVNEKVLESFDLFPAVNLIYSITRDQNLRLSASKTIARPSFKELSYAQILDPLTNRIYNGSLFTYKDWDGNLTETRIQNYDLRWELFLNQNQILSISGFYKSFDDPIELVRIPEQQTSTEYQPRNVGDGQVYGIELEVRKNFEFISPGLKNFAINTNLTLIKSKIDMSTAEFEARKVYEKVGETIDPVRDMAGQAPYVVNVGLTYTNFEKGINTGFFYNVKGETLHIVGGGLFPDIFFQPFHSLNFSFSRKIGLDKRTTIDIRVSNLLNQKVESYYKNFTAQPKIFSSINPGRSFSLGIGHKF